LGNQVRCTICRKRSSGSAAAFLSLAFLWPIDFKSKNVAFASAINQCPMANKANVEGVAQQGMATALLPNSAYRQREYLTEKEVDRLIEAAKRAMELAIRPFRGSKTRTGAPGLLTVLPF
jgi:hypothetical protein